VRLVVFIVLLLGGAIPSVRPVPPRLGRILFKSGPHVETSRGNRGFREVSRLRCAATPGPRRRGSRGEAATRYAVVRGSGALWRGIAWRISLAVLYLPMGM